MSMLSLNQFEKIVYDFKKGESLSYEVKTLCQLFEEQSARHPDRIAIEYRDLTLRFSELNALSNQLARYIRNQYQEITQKELAPNTLIPISIGRSANFIIGILGILKAGGAYVPINPNYPVNRIQDILGDIDGKLLLTESYLSSQYQDHHPELSQILMDECLFLAEASENLYIPLRPTDLAYVIYTSGTSGTPKGILAQHSNVISQVISADYFFADASDTMAFFSDVSFDSTTFELWGSLLNGAKLFIPDDFYELMSNPLLFKETVNKKKLTILLITRSLFDLLYTLDKTLFASLKFLLVGAEALTKNIMLELMQSEYRPKNIINAYGPSENSTFCITNLLNYDFSALNSVPIGRPYSNRIAVVVDKHLQLVPIGMVGEMYVGGPSLSKGYLNKVELTRERFIDNPFFNESGERYPRIYKTGDLAKWLPNGNLEYIGRNDFQVKLRGYRIELSEIETKMLEMNSIKHSVVILDKQGEVSYLIGYYVADSKIDDHLIRNHLAERLPDYMVPAVFVYLETLPVTANGKLDRKALPIPLLQSKAEPLTLFQKEATSIEMVIFSIWARFLNLHHFEKDESFFDLGGNSLTAMMVRKEIETAFSIKFNIVELFQYTTLAALSTRISQLTKSFQNPGFEGKEAEEQSSEATTLEINESIAVIGMSCRLPEAVDLDSFWDLLIKGKSNLRELSAEELKENGVSDALIANHTYVKRGAIYKNPFEFDAGFFGYSVKDAELTDPQHRQFLECAWEALEHSGNVPEKYVGDISVFAAQGRSDYFLNHVFGSKIQQTNAFQAILGNEKDFLSTRVSFKLNLTGPSITLQTACSSSLVSIQMACESLKAHGSDMALAGGVSLFYNYGYQYQDDLIESPDGCCRAFDVQAKGTVVTSGVGIVVLKRLSDAIAERDTIYAIIKGGAVNNDGSSKMAFTAPSIQGQSAVIKKALKNAGISPDQISYIEAHGTGTQVGDPIEWTALHNVYEKYMHENEKCIIGSVKTNIGHTDSAAGVFGLIKTVLALKHKILPATLNYESINPEIASFNKVFRVSNEKLYWEHNGSNRRAAVSSFGLGGTNAHVILEEYNALNKEAVHENGINYFLIPFSAKNRNSLHIISDKLKNYILSTDSRNFRDIAYTTQEGRAEFREKGFFVLKSNDEGDTDPICSQYFHDAINPIKQKMILILSDFKAESFSQFDRLYQNYAKFKDAFDCCAAKIKNNYYFDIQESIDSSNELHTKLFSFSIQYALLQLFLSTHTEPYHIITEGNGMYLSAILLNTLSIENALKELADHGNEKKKNQTHSTNAFDPDDGRFSSSIFIALGQHVALDKNKFVVMHLLPQKEQNAEMSFLNTVGWLWCHGALINWHSIHIFPEHSRKISIPTYCFTKKQYVLEKAKPAHILTHTHCSSGEVSQTIEIQLKEMWSTVLGVSIDELHPAAHFLELGGDSLAFIDLLSLIKTKFFIDLNLEEIIQNNEFGKMFDYINSKKVQKEYV